MKKYNVMNNGRYVNEVLIPKNFSAFVDGMLNEMIPGIENESVLLPKADAYELKESFELELLLPGFSKENIKVEAEGQKLRISGERPMPEAEEDRKDLLNESSFGKMQREFNLPKKADTGNISARFENGILYVSIAKSAEESTRSIEIK